MDQQNNMTGGGMAKSHGMHFHCCWMPMIGGLAWVWGVLSLIFAFMAGDGMFWGAAGSMWMWSGLVSGVLAMSGTRKKLGACKMMGSCCGGMCKDGKCC